jgi:flavin reductase (DIM6/NTAB) family NADH-FMN oxidoreductase RutF
MFSANQTITTATTSSSATPPDPDPPTKQRSPGFNRKDTVHNAESTGYFCWQLATYPLREAVNASAESVPYGTDEFERAGLEKEYSRCLPDGISIPMVKASPVKFECQYHSTLRLPGNPPWGTVDIVIGKVLGVHINEDYLRDGKLDPKLTEPIARLGYYDYTVVRETFEMRIPNTSTEGLAGLEGSVKGNRAVREKLQKQNGMQTEERQ